MTQDDEMEKRLELEIEHNGLVQVLGKLANIVNTMANKDGATGGDKGADYAIVSDMLLDCAELSPK